MHRADVRSGEREGPVELVGRDGPEPVAENVVEGDGEVRLGEDGDVDAGFLKVLVQVGLANQAGHVRVGGGACVRFLPDRDV